MGQLQVARRTDFGHELVVVRQLHRRQRRDLVDSSRTGREHELQQQQPEHQDFHKQRSAGTITKHAKGKRLDNSLQVERLVQVGQVDQPVGSSCNKLDYPAEDILVDLDRTTLKSGEH